MLLKGNNCRKTEFFLYRLVLMYFLHTKSPHVWEHDQLRYVGKMMDKISFLLLFQELFIVRKLTFR